jgi:hypothetical protein
MLRAAPLGKIIISNHDASSKSEMKNKYYLCFSVSKEVFEIKEFSI